MGEPASKGLDTFRRVRAGIGPAYHAHIRTGAGRGPIGTTAHNATVRQATLARQQRTNQPGGYWIAAATPGHTPAAYHAVTGQHPLTDGTGHAEPSCSPPARSSRSVCSTGPAWSTLSRTGRVNSSGRYAPPRAQTRPAGSSPATSATTTPPSPCAPSRTSHDRQQPALGQRRRRRHQHPGPGPRHPTPRQRHLATTRRRLELDESIEDGLRREVEEETGSKSNPYASPASTRTLPSASSRWCSAPARSTESRTPRQKPPASLGGHRARSHPT